MNGRAYQRKRLAKERILVASKKIWRRAPVKKRLCLSFSTFCPILSWRKGFVPYSSFGSISASASAQWVNSFLKFAHRGTNTRLPLEDEEESSEAALAAEEHDDGNSWFYDIRNYLKDRSFPSYATSKDKEIIRRIATRRSSLLFGCEAVSNQNTQQALALPEKEVIQPHLPVRLPCYDFTPVTSPAFGIPLLAVKVTTSGMASSRSVTGGELQPAIRTEDGFLELAHPRGIATLCPVHCSTSERGHFPPVLSSFFCWIAAPALTPMDQTESDDSLYHLLQGPFLFYFLNSVRKDFTVDSAESPTSVYLYEQSIHPDLDPYPDHPVSSFGSPRIINPGSRNTHSIMEMTYI
ncbi:hypothetical protein V6N11_014157 [Hibiscus sabdariffa]|uniref:Uncharacterized protein n=1 Tax=Hibiscus sabdariffa TaxID=183260 RepID=A0ABR2AFR9_9ROSI